MKDRITRALREGAELRLQLIETSATSIDLAAAAMVRCFRSGGKVILFGNGGSAADAQHIAAEFVGRFQRERRPLASLALTTNASVLTSIGNDYSFEQVFVRQLQALGRSGDVVIAISTSGQSPNILTGVRAALEMGLTTVGLTGGSGGEVAQLVDIPIMVPSTNTARIQECHITLGHILCEAVEVELFEQPTPINEPLPAPADKVVDWKTLLAFRQDWRATGNTVVWTNGCFDLLHLGHVTSLIAASALGDILVVGVNSNDSVHQLKGSGRPIYPADERAQMLAALECVDYVLIFEESTPEKVLARLKPDIHCKGADYAPLKGKSLPEAKIVEAYGGRMELLPLLPGHSTSELLRRIREMDQEA